MAILYIKFIVMFTQISRKKEKKNNKKMRKNNRKNHNNNKSANLIEYPQSTVFFVWDANAASTYFGQIS